MVVGGGGDGSMAGDCGPMGMGRGSDNPVVVVDVWRGSWVIDLLFGRKEGERDPKRSAQLLALGVSESCSFTHRPQRRFSSETNSHSRGFSGILGEKVDTRVVPNVNLLRENGVHESGICTLIKTKPRVITTSQVRFKEIVEEVKEMGINPLRRSFVQAVLAIRGMNKSTWERKVNAYKRWGLSEDEILVAFAKSPSCFQASEDKIMKVMDFLVNKMGLEASLIVQRPTLITLSLEKRLIPRASAIQFLQSKGLVKMNFYLPKAFEYVEELFLQRFVLSNKEEASELLQLYKEKMDFPE
ncbi:hypothetical protein CMV_022902 [Castanea mollissima]|uniref:Mitochondrial transcription termination factor family protein n=1 Tax=Castanea mollissima TaxID=60419 RepID=A0A8J4QHM7_9ROSI|nr:hypothetical protein CMV_022902 [Castanea mollissima]